MGNSIVLIAFLWIIRFVLCVQLLNFHFWHYFYYRLSFFENLIQGGVIHGLRKARDILLFNYYIIKGERYEIRGFYHCYKTRPGPAGRPGGCTGPSLIKDRLWQQPGQTLTTQRVDPGPGRTRTRLGLFFFSNVGFETH
jgi:hypothetical protein